MADEHGSGCDGGHGELVVRMLQSMVGKICGLKGLSVALLR